MKMNPTIGVLVPRSNIYPKLARQFLDGIRLAFKNSNLTIEIIVEPIGFGESTSVISDKIQKLELQNQVDFIIGYVGNFGVKSIQDLIIESEIPFLFTNIGGQMVNIKKSEFLHYHRYGLEQCNTQLGAYMAKYHGKKIAVITSFYNSGYNHYNNFELGLKQYDGEIIHLQINKDDLQEQDIYRFYESVNDVSLDGILVLLNGKETQAFLQVSNQLKLDKTLIFLLPEFSMEGWKESKVDFDNLFMVSASSSIQINELQNGGRNPDSKQKNVNQHTCFSLLGYECGLIVNYCIESMGHFGQLNKFDLSANAGERILNWNSKLQGFETDISIYEYRQFKGLFTTNPMEHEIEKITETEINNNSVSGWLNPYMCI